MSKRAIYLGLLAGTFGFALTFALPAFYKFPLLWYYPLGRRWALELLPQGLAMDWYGRTLLASGVFVLGFIVASSVARLVRLSERAFTMWLLWAVTAWTFTMGLYVYQLVQRVPTPEPLPSFYQPR